MLALAIRRAERRVRRFAKERVREPQRARVIEQPRAGEPIRRLARGLVLQARERGHFVQRRIIAQHRHSARQRNRMRVESGERTSDAAGDLWRRDASHTRRALGSERHPAVPQRRGQVAEQERVATRERKTLSGPWPMIQGTRRHPAR